MPRLLLTLAVAALAGTTLAADDLSVQADPSADFSRFRTFEIRPAAIHSDRPELDNSLFAKKIGTTVRRALVSRGLAESTTRPDLVVEVSLTGEDVTASGPPLIRGAGPRPVRFTVGTLTIALHPPNQPDPVWRAIYRDDEQTGSKLVAKLPDDARKLIEKYPALKK